MVVILALSNDKQDHVLAKTGGRHGENMQHIDSLTANAVRRADSLADDAQRASWIADYTLAIDSPVPSRRFDDPDQYAIAVADRALAPISAVKNGQIVDGMPGIDSDRVGGHLVRWGDENRRDLYDEFFTTDTYLALDWNIPRPFLYHHGLDGVLKSAILGVIDMMEVDTIGLWVEAQLDKNRNYLEAIAELIAKKALGWSSGALPSDWAVDARGWVSRWPIIEGSITPTPAEWRTMGDVQHVAAKAFNIPQREYTESGHTLRYPVALDADPIRRFYLEIPDLPQPLKACLGAANTGGDDVQGAKTGDNSQSDTNGATNQMTEPINIQDAVRSAVAEIVPEVVTQTIEAMAEQDRIENLDTENAALKAENDALKAQIAGQPDPDDTPLKRLPMPDAKPPADVDVNRKVTSISVRTVHDDMGLFELATAAMVLKSHASDTLRGTMIDKAAKGGYLVDQNGLPIKADELLYSTQTSYGDEWVPELWSSTLWELARLENVVLALFNPIDMPSDPFKVPVSGAGPTVYLGSEATDQADLDHTTSPTTFSKFQTANVTLNAKKLSLAIGFSEELNEDSIIPIMERVRFEAMQAMNAAIDSAVLNGDLTTGTGNISYYGSAIASNSIYLAYDGLRHCGLVDASGANAIDCNGEPTLAKFRSVRATFSGRHGYNPNNLAWIMDYQTFMKVLGFDEFLTLDKAGPLATALTGQLGILDGIPVFVSAELPNTDTSGYINATGASNTKGSAVLVYRPGWLFGYRRRIKSSVRYIDAGDAYALYAHVRTALVKQETGVAGVLYNIDI